ncbi:murein biosynthesis integral membrane protein MurJ [Dongia sp.]|uniref:murein biosynthesis integral membrane protein MurJ n=1 Tax=Dongia sp. TaxID=1977262 RepID=UPI0035B10AD7
MFSLRSFATVGGMTLMSRILGFVREVLIAQIFGTGPIADAFIVAMRLPNLLRQIFAEGAFSAAFVPVFTRHLTERGMSGARSFAEQVLSPLLIALLAVLVAAELAMPWLIHVFAPGFDADPMKFRAAVLFTSITFPYIVFMSLCALQGGMLNGLHKFAENAVAPVILNAILIATMWFIEGDALFVGEALAWSVTLAGLIQFLWLANACRRAGLGLRLPLPRLTPDAVQFFKLMVPGLFGASVVQINLAVSTILASLHPGSVSYIYYADRLYQLPLALIGSAIGVVLLPALTRSLRSGDPQAAMHMQNRALELGLVLSLPSMVGLIVAALPIVTTVYQRGAFTQADALSVSIALMIMSAGLPAYVANKALTAAFLAREDTTTPFRQAVISVAVNIAISFALTLPYGYIGVAIGAMVSAWVNAILLGAILYRRGFLRLDQRSKRTLPRLSLCCICLGFATWAAIFWLWPGQSATTQAQIVALVAIIALAALVFAGLSLLFRVVSVAELRNLRRKR